MIKHFFLCLALTVVLFMGQVLSNTTQAATEAGAEPSFDRQRVLKDYQGTPLRVVDISEREKDGRNAIAVTLSVPLDPSVNHQNYFHISTELENRVDGAWIVSKSGKTVWFPYTEPSRTYYVSVYKGLEAANGEALKTTEGVEVKTRKIEPSVHFDTSGAYLTQGLVSGLPVVAININEVNVDFFRIKEDDYKRFLDVMARRSNYRKLSRASGLGDLVYSGRFELDAPRNTRVSRSIDVAGVDVLNQPGIYLAVMAEAGAYDNQKMMWFSVTDIGLHARFYDSQLDVYASSLRTGKALPQLDISLLNKKGEILQKTQTSPDGVAIFKRHLKEASLIIAQNEAHLSLIQMNRPALDLSEFDLGERPSRPQELFVYAPRDLYRPGEVVDFNALLRNADGRLEKSQVLTASIRSPDRTQVKGFKWNGDDNGYYHYLWQIPRDAQVGNWQLEVKPGAGKPFRYDFKVEEFLPERLKLTFNHGEAKPIVSSAETGSITLPVQGEYLYGAPAAGNRLTTEVLISQWRKPVESLPDFEFGDARQTKFNARHQLADLYLDSEGRGSIQYREKWNDLKTPLRLNFLSSLYESGGRPATRSYSGLVWPTEKMIGIRPGFGDENPAANSRVSFEIVKASFDGQKHRASNLEVTLVREDRRYYWVYSEHRGWHYEWSDKEFVELSSSLDISRGESAVVEFPVQWGRYRLEVRDPGEKLVSSLRFYAGWNWYAAWKNSQSGSGAARPDQVTMALDKSAYAAGDIAKLNIVPPQAGEAIVLVEGSGPLWSKRIHIPEEGTTLDIPISEKWESHDIYISTVLLQPGNRDKSDTPKRAFGLLYLPLDREDRKLNLAFEVAEKAQPNMTLPVGVRVNKAEGELPSEVFVTLSAVDVGVLSISNFATPDPFEAFFGQRRYSVDAKDMYGNVIEVGQAQVASLRFGGDGDLARGGQESKSDVQIVSLFSGLVQLDANGYANIPLELPDFNGRIRLMALAFSKEQFGSLEQEVTIAAPVVTQLSMPRFLASGDKSSVALDLSNLSGQEQELDVKLTASGPVSEMNDEQIVTLKSEEKKVLKYPVEVLGMTGKVTFNLHVHGEALEKDINRSWSLKLRPSYLATTMHVQKVLNKGESLPLDASMKAKLLPETMEGTVSISSRANLDLGSQLNNLLRYPYGCLEQTSSRLFPLIYATPERQREVGLKALSEDERMKMINKGIERLAMLQLGHGGYGLWSSQSREEHWLTAYVADLLVEARRMGIAVPEEMLDRTLKRLQRYISRDRRFHDERWSDNRDHYQFAYKAYAAYVLSKVNQISLSALRSLEDTRSKDALSGLPQLQLAIASLNMGDKRLAKKLARAAMKNLPQDRDSYYGDYGSQLRDLASMIHLMIKHNFGKKEALGLSFDLADILAHENYLSTQERNMLFLAGIALNDTVDDEWEAELLLGSNSQALEQESSYSRDLSRQELANSVEVQSLNSKPIWANITITGYEKEPPIQKSNEMVIERFWLDLKGEEISLEQVKTGELVLVQLEVNADKKVPDALVVDLLPAGFELENQNLEHVAKLDDIQIDGRSAAEWQRRTKIIHQEYRDDRYVAALDVNDWDTSYLFYLMRAVTPGTYKVPAPFVEDMYRPDVHAIGRGQPDVEVSR